MIWERITGLWVSQAMTPPTRTQYLLALTSYYVSLAVMAGLALRLFVRWVDGL